MISFEGSHNIETVAKEDVIQMFHAEGLTPKSSELYEKWILKKMKEAAESESSYSWIVFNLDVADLLIESNLTSDASNYLIDVWLIIQNEMGRFISTDTEVPDELLHLYERLIFLTEKNK
jgi:hypothetical protein